MAEKKLHLNASLLSVFFGNCDFDGFFSSPHRLFTHIAEMKKKSSNSIHFHLVELFVVKLRVYSISAANKLNLYIFITIFLLNILIFFTHSLSLGRLFIHSFLFHGIDVCVIFSFILFHSLSHFFPFRVYVFRECV